MWSLKTPPVVEEQPVCFSIEEHWKDRTFYHWRAKAALVYFQLPDVGWGSVARYPRTDAHPSSTSRTARCRTTIWNSVTHIHGTEQNEQNVLQIGELVIRTRRGVSNFYSPKFSCAYSFNHLSVRLYVSPMSNHHFSYNLLGRSEAHNFFSLQDH